MLYGFVKIIARAAIKFYCRDLWLNKKALLNCDGPLLLAANHPNSFLDAIILCTIFDKPVYSLARGDAFNGKLVTKILLSLKMLPVYRVSEGVENLEENYKTFDLCKEIFKQNGIVLIFSEGKCINEWHLRPLKKGTARLAISSWTDGIPLKVLPVGINYSSFEKFGKNIRMFFGEFITRNDIDMQDGPGKSIQAFNTKLQNQLAPFVFEIDKTDKAKLKASFYVRQPALKRILLYLPSIAGWLLHAPLFYPVKKIVTKKTNSTDHYDSVVIALLFLAYPVYAGMVTCLFFLYSGQWYALWLLLIFPATAWAHLQLKKQVA
ncbi:MAG: 1-acyl-sn-glycerol-3-phosphate acyltransferase [Ferruginibacter sp.]|nr:1-acyl-sn-glycerol-3-phosphate acyltransferase [Ferruginibacter sp.]